MSCGVVGLLATGSHAVHMLASADIGTSSSPPISYKPPLAGWLQAITGQQPDGGAETNIPALFKDEHTTSALLAASPATLNRQPHGGPPGVQFSDFAPHTRCFVPLSHAAVTHQHQHPPYPAQLPHSVAQDTEGPRLQRGPYFFLPQDALPLNAAGHAGDGQALHAPSMPHGAPSQLSSCISTGVGQTQCLMLAHSRS